MNQGNSLVTTRKRLLIVLLSVTFLFCALTGRLAYLQLIKGREFQGRAAEQWYRDLPLAAPRGKIYDTNGVTLVDNRDVFTIYVRPKAVTDCAAVSRALAENLDLNYDKLFDKIKTSKVSEITILRAVEKSKADRIREKNLDGIYFTMDSKRNYPYAGYLSQILGYTNIDNVGQNGMEGYYNKYLRGVNGFAYTATDIKGNELDENVTRYVPPIPGCNLNLSIDLNIQAFAESAVTDAMTDFNGKGASMIVMDCKTGGILAMAGAPGFDLNSPPRDDINMLNALSKNKMIVDVYEPGSTFKIFTTATALEKGAVNDSNRFFCAGSRLVDGQKIKCWRSIGHGSQDLSLGVKNSCNCVFMDLALKLGTENLYEGLESFGFGSKTNIDFSGESRGLLMNKKTVKNVDLARIGFGQAVAVTPLQLITGVSAAVNGGTLFEPYFLNGVSDFSGKSIYQHEVKSVRKPISSATSAKLCEMLEKVVSEGSGKKSQVPGYRIGGKTGTAQKYENGHIAQGKYISSFVGFAPVEDPRYVVLMIVDEPAGYSYYGSLVAAPYAGDVFKKIFDYTNLAPSVKIETAENVDMPDLLGKTADECAAILKKLGLQFEIAGESGTVTSTLPAPGTKVPKGDIVLIRVSD